MLLEVAAAGAVVLAHVALEGLLARVDAHVAVQVAELDSQAGRLPGRRTCCSLKRSSGAA